MAKLEEKYNALHTMRKSNHVRFKIKCIEKNVNMSDIVDILVERWLNSLE